MKAQVQCSSSNGVTGSYFMHLCAYFPQMQLKCELTVTVPSMGRFGTTISSLADLNGDGLRDVAVGAPHEDNNGGAVYIFLGDKHKGIRKTYSQVRLMKPDRYHNTTGCH